MHFRSMNLLDQAYQPATFQRIAQTLIQALTGYLGEAQTSPSGLNWRPPQELIELAIKSIQNAPPNQHEAKPEAKIEELTTEFLKTANRLHSPHYMGHQVAPALPIAGLIEMLGAVTNQAAGIYEMGPLPTAAEKAMIGILGAHLGWKSGEFDGIGTHGGSIANLTAILAARNIRYPQSWDQGLPRNSIPAVATSSDAHYSLARAAGIAGIGAKNVIKVPIDSRRQITAESLTKALDHAHRENQEVFCVVASSCTTATGAFDPIEPIAEVTRKRRIWLHVDGAHGASLLLSKKHRDKLKGIEHADSVTWDAHKMMFVPALSTFLFFKRKIDSYAAFHQDAPYLFDKVGQSPQEYDSAVRTLECTKRPLALGSWMLWSAFGPTLFEQLIDTTIETTRQFYHLLQETEDFEPLHEPECNILCFRHLPAALRDLPEAKKSEFQKALRQQLIEQGDFYITSTTIDGAATLRVTIMNPFTRKSHLESLMQSLRQIGEKLL